METAVSLVVPVSYDGIVDFCRRWQITGFALLGFVLRSDFRPESNVDVLVTFAPNDHYSLFDLDRMETELSALFGRNADMVAKPTIRNPFRRQEILQNGRVINSAWWNHG